MPRVCGREALALGLAAVALALVGCSTPKPTRAPVEQRQAPRTGTITPPPATAPASTPAPAPNAGALPAEPPRLLPGAENAGKPGYYTVRPGDTLIRIGLDVGQHWRDIARWNAIDNPNLIEVGQVLRVMPPEPAGAVASAASTGATTRPVAASPTIESRPLDARGNPLPPSAAAPGGPPVSPGLALPGAAASASAGSSAAAASPGSAASAPTPAPAREGDEDMAWAWPANGPVLTSFDETRNKGLALGGKAGDPVYAAADGRVVYAGSGLRGYGNLIIVKHNATYLTAYAHNQTLLVKEDQVVRKGQKIAEMGSTESERVQLHFEVRRQGKPVDPARLLPAR